MSSNHAEERASWPTMQALVIRGRHRMANFPILLEHTGYRLLIALLPLTVDVYAATHTATGPCRQVVIDSDHISVLGQIRTPTSDLP
jgi:hypothetical protein